MLFLLNDSVFDLAAAELSLPSAAFRYRRLSVDFVSSLGAELFSENPRLAANEPDRATRLALMITAVAPKINAALFLAPSKNCSPQSVSVRLERVPLAVIDELFASQRAGELTPWQADRRVWNRLAA